MSAPTMPAAVGAPAPRPGHNVATGRWGMICLIATEAALFAYFLFSYAYLGSMQHRWPPEGVPDIRLAGINTIILVASSVVVWWGERGIRAGSRGRLLAGLVAAIVLGVIFLVIQGKEYAAKPFGLSASAYSSLFYTILSFHGAHVFVGLLMLAVVALRTGLGHFGAGRHLAASNAIIYWHFVDVVWLAVFTTIYLTPRFG